MHNCNSQTFRVENKGNNPKSYSVNHIPAGTALTIRPGTIFPSLGPVPLNNVSAFVLLSPDEFSLDPGGSQIVTAIFYLPTTGLDVSTYPLFSGFIEVRDCSDSGSDLYHVSYLGLAANLRDKQVLDNTDHFLGIKLPALLDATGNVQTRPMSYTFVNGDAPTILGRSVIRWVIMKILNLRSVNADSFSVYRHWPLIL